jgi:ElaA protein
VTVQPRAARFADLGPAELYGLLALRTEVFVVEQHCPYPELDGRDAEPGTWHVWLPGTSPLRPAACLRVLAEPAGGARIGRVCTAAGQRGRGLAAVLMRRALALIGDGPVVLHAQSHLASYYARFGFAVAGPEFTEDGIPHLPMRREAVS